MNEVQSSTGTQERYEGSLSSLMLVALGMNFPQTDFRLLSASYIFMLAYNCYSVCQCYVQNAMSMGST